MTDRTFVVVGGGPAGLTAAYRLGQRGHRPRVLEKDHIVGGIARTEQYKGYHFDMGGHRFFTKVKAVDEMWHEVLTDDFLQRPRLSRIFYKGRFFNYPLKPLNALAGLGVLESVLILASYVRWQLFPYKEEQTFEQWVTNRFGDRLYRTFFKTYTEKVWGIPCSELKAEWAAQRIKNLSLKSAVLNMFFKPKRTIKTLIEQFDYPRQGPGMMWRAVTRRVEAAGGQVDLQADVVAIHRDGNRVSGVVVRHADGREETVAGTDFISSMPVSEAVRKMRPPPPPEVLEASRGLSYRDFLTVCLILDAKDLFPDNWIYIHDPRVHVGRIQNFENWSPHMLPDESTTSLGLEYFCSEGDEIWTMADEDLVALGARELEQIGLARADQVVDGCVFRVPKSYPVYDEAYGRHLAVLRDFVDGLENFQQVGRNGLHRYNNQDHAMLTGMYAVENALDGAGHDLWSVNTEEEYHEEVGDGEPGRNKRYVEVALETGLAEVLRKVDRVALGVGVGVLCGIALPLLTAVLLLRGGENVGQTLSLLGHYLPGYNVSPAGCLVGLGYGLVGGFALGWLVAFTRNTMMFLWFAVVRRRAERGFLQDFLDYV